MILSWEGRGWHYLWRSSAGGWEGLGGAEEEGKRSCHCRPRGTIVYWLVPVVTSRSTYPSRPDDNRPRGEWRGKYWRMFELTGKQNVSERLQASQEKGDVNNAYVAIELAIQNCRC